MISIHAPREGCDILLYQVESLSGGISIHAPREGCDRSFPGHPTPHGISIHAPREGCDCGRCRTYLYQAQFQSTHPARGATHRAHTPHWFRCISIHAPREGCDAFLPSQHHSPAISIHAPREGCDPGILTLRTRSRRFQSTHPARGATPAPLDLLIGQQISIHAPREGCDSKLYQRAGSLLGSICLFAQGEEG